MIEEKHRVCRVCLEPVELFKDCIIENNDEAVYSDGTSGLGIGLVGFAARPMTFVHTRCQTSRPKEGK